MGNEDRISIYNCEKNGKAEALVGNAIWQKIVNITVVVFLMQICLQIDDF
jgi:hypothetical protein